MSGKLYEGGAARTFGETLNENLRGTRVSGPPQTPALIDDDPHDAGPDSDATIVTAAPAVRPEDLPKGFASTLYAECESPMRAPGSAGDAHPIFGFREPPAPRTQPPTPPYDPAPPFANREQPSGTRKKTALNSRIPPALASAPPPQLQNVMLANRLPVPVPPVVAARPPAKRDEQRTALIAVAVLLGVMFLGVVAATGYVLGHRASSVATTTR